MKGFPQARITEGDPFHEIKPSRLNEHMGNAITLNQSSYCSGCHLLINQCEHLMWPALLNDVKTEDVIRNEGTSHSS